MLEFPTRLNVDNKDNFPQFKYERDMAYLRRNIYEFMLRRNETDFYALDTFAKECIVSPENLEKMLKVICDELQALGWKTKTEYGNTGLYIYSTEEHPTDNYDEIGG